MLHTTKQRVSLMNLALMLGFRQKINHCKHNYLAENLWRFISKLTIILLIISSWKARLCYFSLPEIDTIPRSKKSQNSLKHICTSRQVPAGTSRQVPAEQMYQEVNATEVLNCNWKRLPQVCIQQHSQVRTEIQSMAINGTKISNAIPVVQCRVLRGDSWYFSGCHQFHCSSWHI